MDPNNQRWSTIPATAELTCTTCNPRFRHVAQRLVVHAALVGHALGPPPARPRRRRTRSPPPSTNDLAGGQGDWTPALEQGLLTALVIAARVPRVPTAAHTGQQRWSVYTVGGVVSVVVLFFFFGAVSPLLPASF